LIAAASLAACAPHAAYRGAVPAPGAITTFAAGSSSTGANTAAQGSAPPRLEPIGTDRARHHLGRLAMPAGSESLVVVLYGDNRPGFRMETHATELAAARGLFSKDPGKWPRGLLFLPIVLIEAIVPTLDGPRDLVTLFTHRPSGGREKGVLKAIEQDPEADLVVSVGDLVYDGRRGRLWEDYAKRHAGLRQRTLYLAAPGNHERLFSDVARSSWNAAMGEPASPERYWYTLDIPEAEARFVFLDSNLFTDKKNRYPDSLVNRLADQQLAWADSALAAPARYRFVMFHHPLVSAGHHYADWDAERPAARRRRLLEMFADRGVTAVITGHEHLYQRVYLRTASGGFWHITTGGAGSPLYPIAKQDWEEALARPLAPGISVAPGSAHLLSEYHICRLVLPRSAGTPRSLPFEIRDVSSNGSTTRIETLDLAQPPSQP
jgi:hypothetical protein